MHSFLPALDSLVFILYAVVTHQVLIGINLIVPLTEIGNVGIPRVYYTKAPTLVLLTSNNISIYLHVLEKVIMNIDIENGLILG